MSKSWTPPKGISVVYKGKGHRKKTKKDESETSEEKDKKAKEPE